MGFNIVGKAIGAYLPELPLFRKPGLGLVQLLDLDTAGTDPACFFRCDDTASFQYAKVLQERRKAHVEWRRQRLDRGGIADRALNDRSSCRVGKRMECGV